MSGSRVPTYSIPSSITVHRSVHGGEIFPIEWEYRYLHSENNPLVQQTIRYGRFLDDLLFIAVADERSVNPFSLYLDSNAMNLKFTVSFHKMSVDFLDITLSHDQGKIQSKSFRKITAGNTILHSQSCHPKHVGTNIPYGEMVRARRNCTNDQNFVTEATNIQNRPRHRGYPTELPQSVSFKSD